MKIFLQNDGFMFLEENIPEQKVSAMGGEYTLLEFDDAKSRYLKDLGNFLLARMSVINLYAADKKQLDGMQNLALMHYQLLKSKTLEEWNKIREAGLDYTRL